MTTQRTTNHQNMWRALATTALLGTDRRSLSLPAASSEIGALIDAVGERTPEDALLAAAAALGQYRRAGFQPHAAQTLPTACPPETQPACNQRAARDLAQMLGGQHRELLPEWFEHANAAGVRVPFSLLVGLLGLGRSQPAFRPAITPLLGERGHWLAAQNPEWHGIVTDDHSILRNQEKALGAWQTANRATRLAWLEFMRQRGDPQALALIESTWNKERADERTALIATLEQGLSMADEPFLETALDDRSKDVRHSAADMLARLPESRLSKRMRARVRALFTWKRRLLRTAAIEVQLPEMCDSAMVRDGVETKARGSLGEKAWWMYQMLCTIPPHHWNNTWNATTTEIIAAAAQTEWRELLLGAWLLATTRHRDADWAETLLSSNALPVNAEIETLIGVLPPQRRERYMSGLIRQETPLVPALLRHCTHQWSTDFARTVLGYLRSQSSSARSPNWMLLSMVKESARYMPPSLAAESASRWPTEAPSWQSWQGAVERLLVVLQFRADMLKALQSTADLRVE